MTSQGERTLLVAAGLGAALGCSRRGASHVREGKPCQDSHALWAGSLEGAPCLLTAVADGHGDDRHDLSQFGAALAAEAALAELRALFVHSRAEPSNAALIRSFKSDFARRVGRRWREAVLAHASSRFPTEAQPVNPQPLLVRYGSTLLAALVAGELILLAQLGDGAVFLLRPDGEVENPFPADGGEVGVVTASLCSPDATHLWQTAVLSRGAGGLLVLATDGLVNAFADDPQLFAFARSLGERIREFGMDKVALSLPEWLDACSARGSGDDITVVLVPLQPGQPPPQVLSSHEVPGNVTGDRTASTGGDGGRQPGGQEKAG